MNCRDIATSKDLKGLSIRSKVDRCSARYYVRRFEWGTRWRGSCRSGGRHLYSLRGATKFLGSTESTLSILPRRPGLYGMNASGRRLKPGVLAVKLAGRTLSAAGYEPRIVLDARVATLIRTYVSKTRHFFVTMRLCHMCQNRTYTGSPTNASLHPRAVNGQITNAFASAVT